MVNHVFKVAGLGKQIPHGGKGGPQRRQNIYVFRPQIRIHLDDFLPVHLGGSGVGRAGKGRRAIHHNTQRFRCRLLYRGPAHLPQPQFHIIRQQIMSFIFGFQTFGPHHQGHIPHTLWPRTDIISNLGCLRPDPVKIAVSGAVDFQLAPVAILKR